MKKPPLIPAVSLLLCAWLLSSHPARANLPGGGTNGPNVTLTDNGSTVTMANGIVSILCTKSGATINQINYTYNNGGGTQTLNLLSGGNNGGQLYWENSSSQGLSFAYSLVADPANNGGNYAEISLVTTSVTGDQLEVHFSMLRGSTGFYTAAIYSHSSSDGAFGMGECRDNIYAGSIFNWMSVDARRNRIMEVSGGSAIGVQGAPKEVSLWTNGIYQGQYEDKYKYSADLGVQRVWGWSSVGAGGKNVGLWNISASAEYYNGGPLKLELMEHIGTTILNMLNGGHYGMGSDGNFAAGEVWSKVCGPYFIYCNKVTNTLTGSSAPAQALYNDALAQGAAEESAWPYTWFTNASYAPAANRGTVTGTMVINDSGNPNASAAGLWVGLVQQPSTTDGVYDFQEWMKPYQFWVQTDANGNFTLSNVITGANYTLYAFGPGAAGTFMSQSQAGGSPPITTDIPAQPFAVSVPGGAVTNLGSVVWSPSRVGPTVFEIGYPDRMADKFRHGDDYWVGDLGPSPNAPSPIWSKWLEYPFDFPNGPNYVVGQSRWSTDWNFVQPVVVSSTGGYGNSSSTITFNLATAPANGAQASFYLGLASDYSSAVIITVNGNNLGSVAGVTGTPNNSIPSTGYYAGYMGSDTTIREGMNAAFSDERLTFPASLLHAGQNTVNIGIRQAGGSYFADHLMYDYIRLELTGYVPPAPGSAVAYAGNNCNLVCWPVVPGATSYNILRSTSLGSNYVALTNGVVGPVCGSGAGYAAFVDATAANGTTYYYEVCSANSTGVSTNSPSSAGAMPSAGISAGAPSVPTGLRVTASGHQNVTLGWNASGGANFYSVWRSVLVNTGGGSSNTLSTILLNNATTGTSYTDTSPTDGSIYRYFVTATGAGGTSAGSTAVVAVPLPPAPASAPMSVTASFVQTNNITLNWLPVPGAIGYVISRATSSGGPYMYLQTVTETTYTDSGLNPAVIYYYRVSALNAAAVSATATDSVNSQQTYPATLSATGGNTQIILSWSPAAGATSYSVKRGTSVGGETATVITGYAGTTYTNTGLANGTTYYYVVTATGSAGSSGNSPEASATPFANASGIWIGANGDWSAPANWSGGAVASGMNSTADFSTLGLPADLTVNLDVPETVSVLKFGDTSGTHDWTVAGTNTLTLGANPVVNVVNQSVAITTPLGGANGLAKIGPGTATLAGVAKTVSGAVSVNAGSLILDLSGSNSPASNLLPATNSLSLGGGMLQMNGASNAVSSQTFASLALSAGASVVSAAPVSGGNNPTLNLGAMTANAGGVVEFAGPATVGAGGVNVASNAAITTTLSGNGAFMGGNGAPFFDAIYATVGLYDYAAAIGTSPPYAVVGGSQISGFYTPASGTAGTSGNLDVTGNITGWSAQPYLISLRFNTGLGANISVAAYSTLTLDDILVTPAVGPYNVSINNNNLRPGGGSFSYAGPYVIWQNNSAGELILNSTLGNSKVGSAAFVQAGPGTVSITGTTTYYTGQNYLNGGVTVIAANGSLGAPATGAAVNLNGGTLVANGTFALDNGGLALRPLNLLGNGGGLAATTGNTFTVDGVIGSAAGAGPLTVGIPASGANFGVAGLLPGTGAGTANNLPVYAAGTVVLTNANYYTGGTVLQSGALSVNGINALGGANYGGVVFNGGTLQFAPNLSGGNGSADLTSIGTAGVTLGAGGGVLDLNGNSVTFAGSIGNGGTGGLVVKSSLAGGILTLQGANTYEGATTITNVTVLADNLAGSATGSGGVLVANGGMLGGNGTVDGPVAVGQGGALVPGGPNNMLNLGNDLAVAAGGTISLAVQHAPLINSALTIAGTLNAGGTLVVTNAGAGALANGDRFQLFSAANYAGGFAGLVLPSLGTNLVWNTNTLLTEGAISVTALAPPAIAAIQFDGSNLVLTGTGGADGWPYIVLATTNLASGAWWPVATNQFNPDGTFALTLTNSAAAGQAPMFYRLRLQ